MTQGLQLENPVTNTTQGKIREKSNEQLQNEIIRMIVEDIPVPQMQHNYHNTHEPKVMKNNWVHPQTPQGLTNIMMMSHSFQNKRGSLQPQPLSSYIG
jgi:hypothetical protein